jgi:hypothetical protein
MSTSINIYDQNRVCTRSDQFKKEILNIREKENLQIQEAPVSCKELAKKVLIVVFVAWAAIAVAYNTNAFLNEDTSECKKGFELGVKGVEKVLNNCIIELSSINFTSCTVQGKIISLTDCFKVCQQYYQANMKSN